MYSCTQICAFWVVHLQRLHWLSKGSPVKIMLSIRGCVCRGVGVSGDGGGGGRYPYEYFSYLSMKNVVSIL